MNKEEKIAQEKEELIQFLTRMGFKKQNNLFYIYQDKDFLNEEYSEYNIIVFLNPFDAKIFECILKTPSHNYSSKLFYRDSDQFDTKIKSYMKLLHGDLTLLKNFNDDCTLIENEINSIISEYGFIQNNDGYYELYAKNGQHITIIKKPNNEFVLSSLKRLNDKEYKNIQYGTIDYNKGILKNAVNKLISQIPYLDGWITYDKEYSENLKLEYLSDESILQHPNAVTITTKIIDTLDPMHWTYFFKIVSEFKNENKDSIFELEITWTNYKDKRKDKLIELIGKFLKEEIDNELISINHEFNSLTIIQINYEKFTDDEINSFIMNLKSVFENVSL